MQRALLQPHLPQYREAAKKARALGEAQKKLEQA